MYSDADVYLLDDVLSAVDAHVGKDLFFEAILSCLKTRRDKAVVLVTHQLQHMQHADKVLVLDGQGTQTFFGSFAALREDGTRLEELGVELTPAIEEPTSTESVSDLNDREGQRSRSSTVGSFTMGDSEGPLFGSSAVGEEVSLDFVTMEGDDDVTQEDALADVSQSGIGTGNDEDDDGEEAKLMRSTIIQSEDRNIGHIT